MATKSRPDPHLPRQGFTVFTSSDLSRDFEWSGVYTRVYRGFTGSADFDGHRRLDYGQLDAGKLLQGFHQCEPICVSDEYEKRLGGLFSDEVVVNCAPSRFRVSGPIT